MNIFEHEHDYYCNDQNYDARPEFGRVGQEFSSVDAFLSEWGDADIMYNLVFRWDYKPADHEIDPEDTNSFQIFVMKQRKGQFWPITIFNVQPGDEPKLKAWLEPRWEYLKKLWAPFG